MKFAHKIRTCLFLPDGIREAAEFYTGLFPESGIDNVVGEPPMVIEFSLAGAPFMLLSGNPGMVASHAVSISVLTADQAETDALWMRLTDGGEAGMCGWLKDRFGVHWQIVPEALPRLMSGGDAAQAGRVQAALMSMQKIDIAALEAAASDH